LKASHINYLRRTKKVKKPQKYRVRMSKRQRDALMGILFTLPFTIGFIFFFLYPFLQSVNFSLSTLTIVPDGYELEAAGWSNYRHALVVHVDYVRVFVETLWRTIWDVPLILIFSFFAAGMLNQAFHGRAAARMIFFLPVILGAGMVLRLEQADYFMTALKEAQQETGGLLSGAFLRQFLQEIRIPLQVFNFIVDAVDRIPEIIRASGVQILIFLAGLQSVPRSLYEAADVEGASSWENFWMITLPMLSPLILTNTVYTVIDSFTAGHNELVVLIRDTAFRGDGFGLSSAMGVMYFLAIAVILGIFTAIISRYVFYNE